MVFPLSVAVGMERAISWLNILFQRQLKASWVSGFQL
jgi:hypothetical protein